MGIRNWIWPLVLVIEGLVLLLLIGFGFLAKSISLAWLQRDWWIVAVALVGLLLGVSVVLSGSCTNNTACDSVWERQKTVGSLICGIVAWVVFVAVTRDGTLSAKHESFARRLREGTAKLVAAKRAEQVAAVAELWQLARESEIHRRAVGWSLRAAAEEWTTDLELATWARNAAASAGSASGELDPPPSAKK
jgi:hypothetical protein